MTTTRFATFNIHSGKPRDRRPSLKLYRESLVALEADIIGLQEVDNWMLRSARIDMTGEGANAVDGEGFFASARRRADLGQYGNALLAKGRIKTTEDVRYPRAKFYWERRVAQVATVFVNNVQWNVANTHLSLHPEEQTTQLQEAAMALARRTGPKVLMDGLRV